MWLFIEYLRLMRLDKPVGFMLLFWPCAFGLAYANASYHQVSHYGLVLFLYGSVVMRAAGCIINDICDRDFDRKVKRTKSRPLAKGSVVIFDAVVLVVLLCIAGGVILLALNLLAITISLASMLLVMLYPLMKRITFFPQLFLGFTFNIGLLIAFASVHNSLNLIILFLYLAAIFWTLGYDTIYGLQDIKDDEKIGVKSTAMRFYRNIKVFLSLCYGAMFFILCLIGIYQEFSYIYYLGMGVVGCHLAWQIISLNKDDSTNCQVRFCSNMYLGVLIYASLYYG